MTDRAEIRTERAPQAIGPYSQGIRAGGFLFTSGQIPLRPSGDLVSGDIRAEAHQALENVRAVLEAGGARMEDVVKATVFLVDLVDFSIVNEVYAEFFRSPPPARSCVQVAALPKGARVEVEAVAVVDPRRSAR
jgi:2-iminobutanoate/2-iminopropanoate deaminase